MLAPLLFFVFAAAAIAAALGTLLARNPIHSALSLVVNLLCVACLYLVLNAQFIGIVQVLVYAGAIMVLFLFVIMLLNLEASKQQIKEALSGKMLAAFAGATALLAMLTFLLARGVGALPAFAIAESTAATGTPRALALQLFTTYALPFELIGLLLLAATIGAVMIAKKRFV